MTDQQRVATVTREFVSQYGKRPEIWVRAPGRIELMGSHSGRNQGLALMLPVDYDTWIAARPRRDGVVHIYSRNTQTGNTFSLKRLSHDDETPWTNHVRGVADSFRRSGYPLRGFDGIVDSTLPIAGGLGSSAALEAATARLFQILAALKIRPGELAQLCHEAAVDFVGVDCDPQDHYAVLLGKSGTVLLLDSRTLSGKRVKLHPSIQIAVCDTRSKQAESEIVQLERQAECEQAIGVLSSFYPGVGSPRDVTLEMLEAQAAELAPRLAQRCRFLVEENARVPALAQALGTGDQMAVGRLASESFTGALDLFDIVSEEMEQMMYAVLDAPGIIGARQTGPGFGGPIVAFVETDQTELFTTHVKQKYWGLAHIRAAIYAVAGADGAGRFRI